MKRIDCIKERCGDTNKNFDREGLIAHIDQLQNELIIANQHAYNLDILNRLTRVLTTTNDPRQVAKECLNAVRLLFPGIAGHIWTSVQECEGLNLLASSGMRHLAPDARYRFHPDEVATKLAMDTRQPMMSRDLRHDPRMLSYQSWALDEGFVTCLILPLLYANDVLGALSLFTREPYDFKEREVDLLQSCAAQAAGAISHARLYQEAHLRSSETEIMAEIVQDINASLELDTILQSVVEAAKSLCHSDVASIALREPGAEAAVMRFRSGNSKQPSPFTIEPGKGVGGHVLLSGKPIRTASYGNDPRFSQDYLRYNQEQGYVAVMVAPICRDEHIQGLLYINNRSPRPFTRPR